MKGSQKTWWCQKEMLFQSNWQLFEFESLKETASFSDFLCSEFPFLLCFIFREGKKKKTQQCLSGFRHIWEFTADCKVPFAQRRSWNEIAGDPGAQGTALISAPPPALHHPTTTWGCSAMENLHLDFLVLFGTSGHQEPVPVPCYSIKKCSLLSSPDRAAQSGQMKQRRSYFCVNKSPVQSGGSH